MNAAIVRNCTAMAKSILAVRTLILLVAVMTAPSVAAQDPWFSADNFRDAASVDGALHVEKRDVLMSEQRNLVRRGEVESPSEEEHQLTKRQAEDGFIVRPVCSSNTELCCGNKIFRGTFDYGAQCCGNNFYDANTARCCQNTIWKTTDYRMNCCDTNLYNTTTHVCCNSTVYKLSPDQQCCGSRLYDSAKQICCDGHATNNNGQVMSCCGRQPYQLSKSHCLRDNVVRDKPANGTGVTAVCGDSVINYGDQICCEGAAHPRTNNQTICCGAKTFDSSHEICCNGTLHAAGNDSSAVIICCGKNVFNPTTQVCCKNRVLQRPKNSVGDDSYCRPSYGLGGARFELAYSPYFTCCGDQIMNDRDTQLCCNDVLHSFATNSERSAWACCNAKAYRQLADDKTCCNGVLVQGANQRCCGTRGYDLNEKVCCNDTIYSHEAVPNNKCCNPRFSF